jgi:hypothetical protein
MTRTVAEYRRIAERAGFSVSKSDGWWWIHLPKIARSREPRLQGGFKGETRAWLAAASLALATD